jgi:hypothetical protein
VAYTLDEAPLRFRARTRDGWHLRCRSTADARASLSRCIRTHDRCSSSSRPRRRVRGSMWISVAISPPSRARLPSDTCRRWPWPTSSRRCSTRRRNRWWCTSARRPT